MCFQAGSLHCGSLLRQGGSESPARGGSQVRAAGSAAAAYTVEKETWQKYPRDYAASLPNVIVKELNCEHMLNREMREQISADMKAFIEKLG